MSFRKEIVVEDSDTGALRGPLFEYIRYTEIKRLLNQIIEAQEKSGIKTISVISDLPGEGKTFFVSVLALGYAFLLKKQVLIFDTTSQTVGGQLYLKRVFGRDSVEAGKDPGDMQGCFEIIDFMSPKNVEGEPTESSDFIIAPMIEKEKEKYDLIIFDTVAINESSKDCMDPIIISKKSDASVLVSSSRSLKSSFDRNFKKQMDQWDINLIGMIYNHGVH